MGYTVGQGQSIIFVSGSATGSDGGYSSSAIVAKWEIDPDDGKSVQLRIPSESFAGSADRIAFYVSASGEIGVNTKTPSGGWQVSGSGTSKQGPTKITGAFELVGDLTSSGIISSSGEITGLAGYTEHTITPAPVGRGDIVRFGTGTSAAGKIYHYKSDGSWELADCTGIATSDGMLAVALGTDPDVDGMLLRGMCKLHTIQGTEAVGDVLYLSETATGTADCVPPAASDEVVRVIGYSLHASSKLVWFNPDNTWVEIA